MSPEELLDAILDAVAELAPDQRRQLQRRLAAAGLLVPETLATDQQRLQAAPALGHKIAQTRAAKPAKSDLPEAPSPHSSFVRPSATDTPRQAQPKQRQATKPTASKPTTSFLSALPPAKFAPAPVERLPAGSPSTQQKSKRTAPYHSPISGKVVMGSPTNAESKTSDPHLMPPLPGQAPERPLIVVIERGSYTLRWPGEAPQRVRLTFRAHVTEQEAFYDTLIGLLETVEQRLRDTKADPQTARLDIRCADPLFVQQVRGEIPCEDITLRVRRTHAMKMLDHFAEWRIVHQT